MDWNGATVTGMDYGFLFLYSRCTISHCPQLLSSLLTIAVKLMHVTFDPYNYEKDIWIANTRQNWLWVGQEVISYIAYPGIAMENFFHKSGAHYGLLTKFHSPFHSHFTIPAHFSVQWFETLHVTLSYAHVLHRCEQLYNWTMDTGEWMRISSQRDWDMWGYKELIGQLTETGMMATSIHLYIW